MKVAFTICSNNYLAKAQIVAESFYQHHPDVQFTIFLVDVLNHKVEYENFAPIKIVEVKTVIDQISDLALKYNIIELNTAVKPGIFRYLFEDENCTTAIYLDPDTMVYDRLTETDDIFSISENNIIVTPHFCSPIDDGKYPSEIDFSVYGLYNLGFIAIKNSLESKRFLSWWHDRLMKYCFIRPERGMFTDQIWINYAPLFFDGLYILKHLGYNVANWNLYERKISRSESRYYINENVPLKFFHFSHFVFSEPHMISRSQTRHSIEELPHLKVMLDDYKEKLVQNNHAFYNEISCAYDQMYNDYHNSLPKQENTLKEKVKLRLNFYLDKILGEN